jgi:hypothetical protein
VPLAAVLASTRATRRAVRRTKWLAIGPSMALVACSGAVASTPTEDGGGVPIAAKVDAASEGAAREDAALADARAEDGEAAAAESGTSRLDGATACSERSGTFMCSGTSCDRRTGVCFQTTCMTYASFLVDYDQSDASSCGPCPTCDCAAALFPSASCHCTDDGAGGITLSCQGCYGAPPARRKRIA